MFHKHGSPTNQPKKNLIKRIVGACAMLAVVLALVATPALARGWGRTNGGSGTTSGAYCTTPGTHCENAGCTGFIDNDNDGICDQCNSSSCPQNNKANSSSKNSQDTTSTNVRRHGNHQSGVRHGQAQRQHHNCR